MATRERRHTARTRAEEIEEIRESLLEFLEWYWERRGTRRQAERAFDSLPPEVVDSMDRALRRYPDKVAAFRAIDRELAELAEYERRLQVQRQYEGGGGYDEEGWRPVLWGQRLPAPRTRPSHLFGSGRSRRTR